MAKKLNDAHVTTMRRLYDMGAINMEREAERYGVTRQAIADALFGRTYAHVPEPATPRGNAMKRGQLADTTVAVLRLWDAGERDYWKIGNKVGKSYHRVAQIISQHGRARKARKTPIRNGRSVRCIVPTEVTEEALRRNVSNRQLVEELLNGIAEDNLFKALLDD